MLELLHRRRRREVEEYRRRRRSCKLLTISDHVWAAGGGRNKNGVRRRFARGIKKIWIVL